MRQFKILISFLMASMVPALALAERAAESAPVDAHQTRDVPTLSEWGLIVMVAVVLGAGLLVIARRRKALGR